MTEQLTLTADTCDTGAAYLNACDAYTDALHAFDSDTTNAARAAYNAAGRAYNADNHGKADCATYLNAGIAYADPRKDSTKP